MTASPNGWPFPYGSAIGFSIRSFSGPFGRARKRRTMKTHPPEFWGLGRTHCPNVRNAAPGSISEKKAASLIGSHGI